MKNPWLSNLRRLTRRCLSRLGRRRGPPQSSRVQFALADAALQSEQQVLAVRLRDDLICSARGGGRLDDEIGKLSLQLRMDVNLGLLYANDAALLGE